MYPFDVLVDDQDQEAQRQDLDRRVPCTKSTAGLTPTASRPPRSRRDHHFDVIRHANGGDDRIERNDIQHHDLLMTPANEAEAAWLRMLGPLSFVNLRRCL